MSTLRPHHGFEPHDAASNDKLNWLRAGVLGANDGIVSIAALVVGIAAATTDIGAILLAGVAGLSAGAISMALGEYVSVSSQKDSEKAWVNKERRELEQFPEEEFEELSETKWDTINELSEALDLIQATMGLIQLQYTDEEIQQGAQRHYAKLQGRDRKIIGEIDISVEVEG
jgi:VIT1/CCC1 family predicted Fe2+/Mn2+ transporter